jgi:hypothetical protein
LDVGFGNFEVFDLGLKLQKDLFGFGSQGGGDLGFGFQKCLLSLGLNDFLGNSSLDGGSFGGCGVSDSGFNIEEFLNLRDSLKLFVSGIDCRLSLLCYLLITSHLLCSTFLILGCIIEGLVILAPRVIKSIGQHAIALGVACQGVVSPIFLC